MSILTQQVSANSRDYYFLLANASTLNVNYISSGQVVSGSISTTILNANSGNVSTLAAGTISTAVLEVDDGIFSTFSTVLGEVNELQTSTIFTTELTLDSQTLNATPTELLLNGIPVATLSNLSSIADWALDPAISTVNMLGNNIISCGTIVSQSGMFNNLMVQNLFALSTYVSTVSSLELIADNGFFTSSLVSPVVSTQALYVSSINNNELTASSISVSSIVTEIISSAFLQASSISGTFVSTIGAEIRQGLMSSIVFSPKVEFPINFNFDFKPLAAAIESGLTRIAVAVGGGLVAVGSGLVALAVSRDGTTNINNNYYEQYAVPTQFQFSTLGEFTSTFFRYVSSSGLPNTIPGVELIASTVIAPGTLAVRSVGDPVNLADPSTVTSSIQAYGQWVALPPETTASSFSTFFVGDLTANRITTSSIVGGEASLLTIGAPLIYLSTAAGLGGLVYTDGEMDALRFESRDVWTSSILTSSINASTLLASFIQPDGSDLTIRQGTGTEISLTPGAIRVDALDAAVTSGDNAVGLFVDGIASTVTLSAASSIRMFPGLATPSWVEINGDVNVIGGLNASSGSFLSTLSTATIFGANPNLFAPALLGNPGLKLDAPEIFLSTGQTNITGFINASTIGANRVYSRLGEFSTLNVTGLSTVTLSTLGTAGLAAQPAGRLGVIGNDVDLGQQDLWCQQIRLGAGNPGGSAQTEVIWYSPDNLTTRGIGLGGSDFTLRLQSTINSGTNNGYLLDTTINRPFFSTLAGTSTALMAVYPSTNLGSFGVSTLSVMPEINYFGSWYSSTSQTVVGANTETPLTYNSESMNVGGFTYAGSTITVPVAGRYEITHSIQFDTTSGGTNSVSFWLKKNGANLAQSGSIVSIVNNGDTLGTISIFDTAAANDQYAVSIYSADNNMSAAAVAAAGAVPGIPSIITNIKRLG